MTTTTKTQAFFCATLAQHGAEITVTVDEATQGLIFRAMYETGEPFQVWLELPGGAQMIAIDPAAGGCRYDMRPARPVPVHPQDGTLLSAEQVNAIRQAGQQEGRVQPNDPRYGQIVPLARVVPLRFPSLSQRLSATLAMLVNGAGPVAELEAHTPPQPAVPAAAQSQA